MKKCNQIILLCVIATLLIGCTQYSIQYAKVLSHAEQQNIDYDSITNLDSIKLAVDYFDTYGSANERIRAHYLLGCAYRDMGEAPLALESYQDAINSADTTTPNCDYRQLIKVHAQMSDLFHKQFLPIEQLAELEQMRKCAMLVNDTLTAINAIEHKSGVYELLNFPDSIIKIRLSAYKMYKEKGYTMEAARAVGPIISLLVVAGRIEEAKHFQEIYEKESGYWNKGKINKRKAIYYYGKGNYYLAINKIDSAKLYFQRLLSSDLTINHREAGYRGLYLLYKKTGQTDSMAKYADLCYQLSYESFSSTASNKMQQMQALYNYNRSQKEANTMKVKANHNWLLFLATSLMLVLVLAIGSYFYQIRRKEIDILYIQYENTKANLEKAKREQKKMEEENNNLLEEKNQEILIYEQQVRDYEAKLKIERKKVTNEELMESHIYKHMKDILTYQKEKMHNNDWKELRNMINEKIPCFYSETHANKAGLQEKDYDLCILIRLYFTPSEIAALTDLSSSNISMKRIRLLKKIYGIDGSPEDFDKRIRSIF